MKIKTSPVVAATFVSALTASMLLMPRAGAMQYDVYVMTIGDGTSLGATASPQTILQYSSNGTSSGTALEDFYQAPTVTDGGNYRITQAGNLVTYGTMTLSTNGQYLVFGGRDAEVGASLSGAAGVIGTFHLGTQTFNTSTRITTAGSNGPRGVVSDNGERFWFAGESTGGTGVRYVELGDNLPGQATNVSTNTNPYAWLNIYNGTIYGSRRSGSATGVHSYSNGLSTTANTMAATSLNWGTGWTPGTSNPTDFHFLNDTTLFLGVTSSNHNLRVFYLEDGVWNMSFQLEALGAGVSVTNFSLIDEGSQSRIFLVTQTPDENNGLWSVTWNPLDGFTGLEQIASAGAGYTFAGVVAIPVPEPSTVILILTAAVFVAVRLARRGHHKAATV